MTVGRAQAPQDDPTPATLPRNAILEIRTELMIGTPTTETQTHEDLNPQETTEWLEAFDEILEDGGTPRAAYLLNRLTHHAAQYGVTSKQNLLTPYINTIPVDEEEPYPGDRAIERSIKSLIRWNAMCMVVRANKYDSGIGGPNSPHPPPAPPPARGPHPFFHPPHRHHPHH